MAIDFLLKRDVIEEIIPSNAAATSLNSGVSGAWSGWTEVTGSTTIPFVLCGAYVMEIFQIMDQGAQSGVLNLQVGTGASGMEAAVAEAHGGLLLSPGGTAQAVTGLTGRTHFFEPRLIAAGTRIAVRASATTSVAVLLALYLFGYDASSFGLPLSYVDHERYMKGLSSPAMGATCYPSPGLTAVTSGGALWAYGSWTQFIAAAPRPILITGLVGAATAIHRAAQVKIGIGPPGSEAAMSKVGVPGRIGIPGPFGDCYLPRPLFVKPGERVAVQAAASAANLQVNIGLKGFELL
jgi:hypothetical protein